MESEERKMKQYWIMYIKKIHKFTGVLTRHFACLSTEKGTEPEFLNVYGPRNRFQLNDSSTLCSPAGRYGNPFPTWFLIPIECLKIPAQFSFSCTRPTRPEAQFSSQTWGFLIQYCTMFTLKTSFKPLLLGGGGRGGVKSVSWGDCK
jgi:hypothetical protein